MSLPSLDLLTVILLALLSVLNRTSANVSSSAGSSVHYLSRQLLAKSPWYPSAKTSLTQRRRRSRIDETAAATTATTTMTQPVSVTSVVGTKSSSSRPSSSYRITNKSDVKLDQAPPAPESPAAWNAMAPKHKTLLASLAESFQDRLLIQGGRDIHTPRLLQACKVLEKTLRRVGQRANANELALNIQKVETVYRIAPHDSRDTVSSLLKFEKSLGIHQPNGLLKDPSAAIGLLWLRRSLEFQNALYSLILAGDKQQQQQQQNKKDDGRDFATQASLQAYRQTLEHNHGWKIRRIYTLALRTSTPTRDEMLLSLGGFGASIRKMGPEQEQVIERDMKLLLHTWKPLIAQWKHIFVSLDLEDNRRV